MSCNCRWKEIKTKKSSSQETSHNEIKKKSFSKTKNFFQNLCEWKFFERKKVSAVRIAKSLFICVDVIKVCNQTKVYEINQLRVKE